MWHLGTWVIAGLGSAGGIVGLDGLRGVFHLINSVILWFCVNRKIMYLKQSQLCWRVSILRWKNYGHPMALLSGFTLHVGSLGRSSCSN